MAGEMQWEGATNYNSNACRLRKESPRVSIRIVEYSMEKLIADEELLGELAYGLQHR